MRPSAFSWTSSCSRHVTSQFVTLFDTQQIEVYRGPQGTLFGKNTTGGVISITTKRPKLNEYTAEIEAGYGQYDSGSASERQGRAQHADG